MPQTEGRKDREPLAVCGGRINDPEAFPSAVFHGEKVYFCTRSCLKVFKKDPERFMAGEVEHPVEEEG